VLLIGLAAAVGLEGSYVAIAGNPLAPKTQAPVFEAAPVRSGTRRAG
jgi:hypothetical protein